MQLRLVAAVVVALLPVLAVALEIPLPQTRTPTTKLSAVEAQFRAFMVRFNRTYTLGSAEYAQRLALFSANVERMQVLAHNNPQATFAVNKYSDWSRSEFRRLVSMPVPAQTLAVSCLANGVSFTEAEYKSLAPPPNSFDWRTKGKVAPIKDQGQCGSCWAFSTISVIETYNAIKSGTLTTLSEQQIVDCSKGCVNEPPYGVVCNQGCEGGWMWSAMTDVMSWPGLATEAQYPYTAEDGTCQTSPNFDTAPVTNYTCMSGAGQMNDGPASEVQMVSVIANKGTLSIAMDADILMSYSSGILNPGPGDCSQTQLNHGIDIVGYAQQSALKYWIVRNSWGSDWGESGYFRIVRNKNACGLATGVLYPIMK